MKDKIKYYLYNSLRIFNKKNIFYLLICFLVMNIFAWNSSSLYYGVLNNFILNLNDDTYWSMFFAIVTYLIFYFCKLYNSRTELITRYKTIENYHKYIIRSIILNITIIYFLDIIVLFLIRTFADYFLFGNEMYELYSIKSSYYSIWIIIRNYIYIILYIWIITNFKFTLKNSTLFIIIFAFYMLFFINIYDYMGNIGQYLKVYFINYYMKYSEFSSFGKEIYMFIYSIIIKYFLLSFIFCLKNRGLNVFKKNT